MCPIPLNQSIHLNVGTRGSVSPPGCIEVALHKVVKRPHVLLFSKQDMVGDALQDLPMKEDLLILSLLRNPPCSRSHLGHELQAPFDAGKRFLLQDSSLVGRHDGWVDKAQEHGAPHRSDAVLWEALAHHLCVYRWRERDTIEEGTRRNGWKEKEKEF